MEDKLIEILQDYKENENEIDSVDAIFRLFIINQPNGEFLISFIEQLKYDFTGKCELRDINFTNMYETLNRIL